MSSFEFIICEKIFCVKYNTNSKIGNMFSTRNVNTVNKISSQNYFSERVFFHFCKQMNKWFFRAKKKFSTNESMNGIIFSSTIRLLFR